MEFVNVCLYSLEHTDSALVRRVSSGCDHTGNVELVIRLYQVWELALGMISTDGVQASVTTG